MENLEKMDTYILLDIGARYQVKLANIPVTLRLNVNNLTDKYIFLYCTACSELPALVEPIFFLHLPL